MSGYTVIALRRSRISSRETVLSLVAETLSSGRQHQEGAVPTSIILMLMEHPELTSKTFLTAQRFKSREERPYETMHIVIRQMS